MVGFLASPETESLAFARDGKIDWLWKRSRISVSGSRMLLVVESSLLILRGLRSDCSEERREQERHRWSLK